MTAPTQGLGAVFPFPSLASQTASRMKSFIAGSLWQQLEIYSGFLEHVLSQFVRIAVGEIYFPDLTVYEHFGADKAGLCGAVDSCPGYAYSVHRGLDYHIL